MGKSHGTSTTSPGALLSPNLHALTNLEGLQSLSFWAFVEASLHRQDWLNHWPLVIDSASNPSPLPGVWGAGVLGLQVPTL